MMRKDEPPVVTLVLMNARVLLILDWLNQAKDFILMNTEFVPPGELFCSILISFHILEEDINHQVSFGVPKDGVLVRNPSSTHLPSQASLRTITLKITLKESDLLLLEDASKTNSLALVGHTTAVLNLNDATGVLESNLEIQNMNLSWCLMSAEQLTCCQLSNEFNLTVVMNKETQSLSGGVSRGSGLYSLDSGPRQVLKFEVGEVVCRTSYKDLLVVKAVIQGASNRLQSSLTLSQHPSMSKAATPRSDEQIISEKPGAINIRSVSVNAPNVCAWFLDDSQGVALPLIRFVVTSLLNQTLNYLILLSRSPNALHEQEDRHEHDLRC